MVRIDASVLVVLLAVAGCSRNQAPTPAANPGATTQSAPTTIASPGPTASTALAPAFTADGIGPYLLGAKLSDLKTAGVLDEVKPGTETCDYTSARGTGAYQDISMIFRPGGTLRVVTNRSAGIPASSGARLGNTLAELQTIYGSAGEKLTRDDGEVAYLATATSGHGILFHFDDKNKVAKMVADDATGLKAGFINPIDWC